MRPALQRILFGGNQYNYYIDSQAGNDANPGTSPALAFASFAPLNTLGSVPNGTKIGVKYNPGTRITSSLTLTGGNNILVQGYGAGVVPGTTALPYIDCRDAATAANWTLVSGTTYSNTVTLAAGINVASLGNIWDVDTFLLQQTSLANCEATPGSCYIASWTASGTPTIYVNLSDGSNPKTNGRAVYFSSRLWSVAIQGGSNNRVSNLYTRGNLHAGGSIQVTTPCTYPTVDGCYIQDGSRHSCIMPTTGTAKNNYFYRVNDQIDIGPNFLVFNQADMTGTSFSTLGNTFDIGGWSPNGVGLNSAILAHDNTPGHLAASSTHSGDTYIGCGGVAADWATSVTLNNPVFSSVTGAFAFANNGTTITVNNPSGTMVGPKSGFFANGGTASGNLVISGGSLTITSAALDFYSTSGGAINVTFNGGFTLNAKGYSNYGGPVGQLVNLSAGTLTLNNFTLGPTLGCAVGLGASQPALQAQTIVGNNNTYPYGVAFNSAATNYTTLAAWQVAGQDAASVYGAITANFSDNFTRANQNLEASANWTRVDGVAGALAILSNSLVYAVGTDTSYQAPTNGSAAMWVRWITATANDGYHGFVGARVTDKNNYLGVFWTGTQYAIWSYIAGVANQFDVANQTTNVGDDVVFSVYGDTCSLIVNKICVIAEHSMGNAALPTSNLPGLINLGQGGNAAFISSFVTGPI